MVPSSGWFAVRCVFRSGWPLPTSSEEDPCYEERITVWRACDIDEAIAKAEAEAISYAAVIEAAPSEYLGLAQAYQLFDAPDHDGAEVFSLIRDSRLSGPAYLDAYFDTGHERQRTITNPTA